MVSGVATVWLPVTDTKRAVAFYTEKLGLEVDQQDETWAELKLDGLRIGLNGNPDASPAGDGGAVVAFRPEGELEAAVEALERQGVEFAGKVSEHPWGRIATFKDPDGNDLQLYAPPKD